MRTDMASELIEGREDERVVEYPFVLKSLSEGIHSILDVGCLESPLTKFLSEKGFFVVGIDLRKPVGVEVNFVQCDARFLPFKSDCFDLAIGVSTLEHVGLISYGFERWKGYAPDQRGDRKALDEMARVSKEMIVTLPYGWGDFYWLRVYNVYTLDRLLAGYKKQIEEFYKIIGDQWVACTKSEHLISEGRVKGVVCLKVIK